TQFAVVVTDQLQLELAVTLIKAVPPVDATAASPGEILAQPPPPPPPEPPEGVGLPSNTFVCVMLNVAPPTFNTPDRVTPLSFRSIAYDSMEFPVPLVCSGVIHGAFQSTDQLQLLGAETVI